MCIICKGKDLTGLKELDVSFCQNITEIPHIKGLQQLYCNNTNITKIPDFYASKTSGLNEDDAPDFYASKTSGLNEDDAPNIKGLAYLNCRNTNITKIPNIIGLQMLDCWNTDITEIPNIEGLRELYCEYTNITEIPHIETLEMLNCDNTNITKIPHIEGLINLWCSNTNITEIPNIEGCMIFSKECKWLNPPQERLDKVIRLQKWFRRYSLYMKLINIIPEITKIYFTPGMKGYMLNKRKFDLFIG